MNTFSLSEPLAQCVKESIHRRGAHFYRVDVDATGSDTVHLSGEVPSFYLRQVAVSIAKHVAGVRHVSDGIRVRSSVSNHLRSALQVSDSP